MVDSEKVTHVSCHAQNNYYKNCSSNPKKRERKREKEIET